MPNIGARPAAGFSRRTSRRELVMLLLVASSVLLATFPFMDLLGH